MNIHISLIVFLIQLYEKAVDSVAVGVDCIVQSMIFSPVYVVISAGRDSESGQHIHNILLLSSSFVSTHQFLEFLSCHEQRENNVAFFFFFFFSTFNCTVRTQVFFRQ